MGSASALELSVLGDDGGVQQTVVRLPIANLTMRALGVEIDRSAADGRSNVPPLRGTCWLGDRSSEPTVSIRVFVDATIVEVFVNGGRLAMTTRVYPRDSTGRLAVRAVGCCPLALASVEAYELGGIWV